MNYSEESNGFDMSSPQCVQGIQRLRADGTTEIGNTQGD